MSRWEFLIAVIFLVIIFLIILFAVNNNSNEVTNESDNNRIYTAVIIEPRKHKALEFVLNNFLENLDEKWGFIIFHGKNNEHYVNEIIMKMSDENKRRVSIFNLGVENLSIGEYSKLFADEDFYKLIPTEMFLIFQTDSMICDNKNNMIEEFMEYDYVGAPWGDGIIGNGGLSLRRKSKMLEMIQTCNYTGQNEDIFFCRECPDIPLYTPDMEIAKKFSIETVMSEHAFGIHKPWPYLPEHVDTIRSFCPGFDTLVQLQSVIV